METSSTISSKPVTSFQSGREKGYFVAMVIFVIATIVFAGLYGASASSSKDASGSYVDPSGCNCSSGGSIDCSACATDCSATDCSGDGCISVEYDDGGIPIAYTRTDCSSVCVSDGSCCIDASQWPMCTASQCVAYCNEYYSGISSFDNNNPSCICDDGSGTIEREFRCPDPSNGCIYDENGNSPICSGSSCETTCVTTTMDLSCNSCCGCDDVSGEACNCPECPSCPTCYGTSGNYQMCTGDATATIDYCACNPSTNSQCQNYDCPSLAIKNCNDQNISGGDFCVSKENDNCSSLTSNLVGTTRSCSDFGCIKNGGSCTGSSIVTNQDGVCACKASTNEGCNFDCTGVDAANCMNDKAGGSNDNCIKMVKGTKCSEADTTSCWQVPGCFPSLGESWPYDTL